MVLIKLLTDNGENQEQNVDDSAVEHGGALSEEAVAVDDILNCEGRIVVSAAADHIRVERWHLLFAYSFLGHPRVN